MKEVNILKELVTGHGGLGYHRHVICAENIMKHQLTSFDTDL